MTAHQYSCIWSHSHFPSQTLERIFNWEVVKPGTMEMEMETETEMETEMEMEMEWK